MNQDQYTRRVYQNESQLSFKKSLRSYSDTSRNSTSTESGSSKTQRENITTPTKIQVSTEAQTPYVVLLGIKNNKKSVFSAPLASKQAQKLLGQMQSKDVTFRRNLITSITPQKKNRDVSSISKVSNQSSSISYGTSTPSLQHSHSSITLNSRSSFGARNANLNGYVANLFATGAQIKSTLDGTAAFGNNADKYPPQPTTLAVKPENFNDCRSQFTTNAGGMDAATNVGGDNSGASKKRRSRSQRLAERSQTSVFTPAINSSLHHAIVVKKTINDTKSESFTKKQSAKKKLLDIKKIYNISPAIQKSKLELLQFGKRHNFDQSTSNNAATVTYDQNQDFNKRQRFPGGILKHSNSASAKQDQSRLANLAKPKQAKQALTQGILSDKNQQIPYGPRPCIVSFDSNGNYLDSNGRTGRGPALYRSK